MISKFDCLENKAKMYANKLPMLWLAFLAGNSKVVEEEKIRATVVIC